MTESTMMAGGWDYVITAYSITFLVLAVYAWNLIRRSRADDNED